MPTISIFIRNEDLPKWRLLQNKSQWLHDRLATHIVVSSSEVPMTAGNPSMLKTIESPFIPGPPDPVTGYPCCLKKNPCKHWHFDGVTEEWTNELTGEVREPET